MLAFNHPAFLQISLGCPGIQKGKHTHAKWSQALVNNQPVFASHDERAYPSGLCAAVAQVILQLCRSYAPLATTSKSFGAFFHTD